MAGERGTPKVIESLSPQEKLLLVSQVNRLCASDPETFDLDVQVADAQAIVNILDSRIKPSKKFGGRFTNTTQSSSEVQEGATDIGDVSTSFEEERTTQLQFGIEEYRIGNYVAVKRIDRRKKTTFMIFEHFRDRGVVNEAFGQSPERTIVSYGDELKITKISRGIPIQRQVACLMFVDYKDIPLWEMEDLD